MLTGPKAVAFVGEDIGKVSHAQDWIKAEKIVEITGALLESLPCWTPPGRVAVRSAHQGADVGFDPGRAERTSRQPCPYPERPEQLSLVRVINAYVEKQQGKKAGITAPPFAVDCLVGRKRPNQSWHENWPLYDAGLYNLNREENTNG